MERKKRILWLFNHTTLRKVQAPLLISLGYEVYCPKSCSWEWGDFSTSVSYEFDASLTLPQSVLETLNRTDFYEPLPDEVMALVNEYFDIVFCIAVLEIAEAYVSHFHGVTVVQGFGLAGNASYTDLFTDTWKGLARYGLLSRIRARGEKFWLLLSYENLAAIEAPVLQNKSIFLPLGMKNAVPQRRWKGGDRRVLFVSPEIKTNSYYEAVYRDFKTRFGDLPHVIGGAQLQPVPEDKTVTGFLPDEAYTYNMTHLAAMFYHSQEPRHLHYHPIEAVKWGMPLVFMAGGMLDALGGERLPGRARTTAEARKKLERLLSGDQAFIRAVTTAQEALLRPFAEEFCRPYWEAGMARIAASCGAPRARKRKKLAVILPAAYLGGVADYARRFASLLQEQKEARDDDIEIVFAYPEAKVYEEKAYFEDLRRLGISLRTFWVERRTADWAMQTLDLAGYKPAYFPSGLPERVCVLRDGAADFQDIDFAVFMSDTVGGAPLFFLRPYAMVVHDYIQRYVPEAVSPEMDQVKCVNHRNAEYVLVTSEPTRQDALQHGGIDAWRVKLTPPLLDFLPFCEKREKGDYFLWSTNATPHKNHRIALRALEAYYAMGGRLDCVVTGVDTLLLSPEASSKSPQSVLSRIFDAKVRRRIRDSGVWGARFENYLGMYLEQGRSEYLELVRRYISASTFLNKRMVFKGNMHKEAYYQCLAGARFIFHPGYGDNGNFTVTDAASAGVPALSADYPAMRYLAAFAGVPVQYTSPFSAEEMGTALLCMERNAAAYAAALPARQMLEERSYRRQGAALYDLVKGMAGI